MEIAVLAFGIVKEIFGAASVHRELHDGATVLELKNGLAASYPALKKLSTCLIAVNNEYAGDDQVIHPDDEIAVIPPVSGG
ncbi:molybdopterin synthase sulfur carrier subunit [Niabella ginsenosidivorans]|uniref:Molybdopterin synthase sulfur carrier subunit n=1 Tax=Niabella ginsenosidivorans TaxID=1176587 RepID=A0A1A9HZK3_9BACT|nr:MoaD/ThiS family protein [Niabella ginsenosidivorans]ANH80515.1 molybdopterin synthase sulfur carrier subunit [Niabella ginsenosidivorans]